MIDQLDNLKILTNNRPRDTLHWWDLTTKEQAEFDYLDTEGKQNEADFFRYRGWTFHTGDIPSLRGTAVGHTHFRGWHAQLSDSFFSGILVKYVYVDGEYTDQVIVGRYYC